MVNDFAEHGVTLMQTYNLSLTKDEDQRQFLLHIIENHRKRYRYAASRLRLLIRPREVRN